MSDQIIQNDILPTEDGTFSLGSASKPWKLYANTINGVAPEEMGGEGDGLPEVSSADNGRMLTVQGGDYTIQPFNTTFTTKTITESGTYHAYEDEADGYSSVVVDISGGGPGRSPRSNVVSEYSGSNIYGSSVDFELDEEITDEETASE